MNNTAECTVYISQGPLAAEVALAKLTSAGIPARLSYQAVGRALGITVSGLGRVEVVVPQEYADEARALLAESDESQSDLAESD